MRTVRRPLALTALGAVLVVSTACGKASEAVSEAATERILEQAGGGDVDIDFDGDGAFEVKTEDGSFSTGTGEIPGSWPDDVPLPPLRDVVGSEINDANGGELVNVAGATDLSIEEVEAFFADALDGWTETLRSSFGDGSSQTLQLGYDLDGRTLVVGAYADGDDVALTLSYATSS